MKLAIVVRKDLGMSCGKIAGQVGHASVMAYRKITDFALEDGRWYDEGQKKIVLKVPDLPTLLQIKETAILNKLQVNEVVDFGLTQIEPNTLTCIAIGPDEDEKIDAVVKELKLL
jgi:PTH2 family peptidyl-tRNA hydrolase